MQKKNAATTIACDTMQLGYYTSCSNNKRETRKKNETSQSCQSSEAHSGCSVVNSQSSPCMYMNHAKRNRWTLIACGTEAEWNAKA